MTDTPRSCVPDASPPVAAVHAGDRCRRRRSSQRVDEQRGCPTAGGLFPVQHFDIVCEGSPGEPRVLEDDDNLLGLGTRQYRQGGVGWDFCEAVLSLVPIVNEVLRGLVAGDTLGPVGEEQRRVVDVARRVLAGLIDAMIARSIRRTITVFGLIEHRSYQARRT